MDWNSKTSSDWDWESLAMFSAKTIEIAKQVEFSSHAIEGQGVKNGSLYSSAIAGISSSDLKYISSSRSSISASADSSLKEGVKTFSTIDGLPKDCGQKEEVSGVNNCENFPTLASSVKSGEPMIGLKLGKWTYFENMCIAGTNKTTSFPESAVATKRSRMTYQSALNPRCQVEGCNLDLKSAKDYHRRHRICETHSKSPWVIVAGLERRFCQQCSRFHDLSEFDDKKRSCRRRLSDHNARRRKPKPAVMQLNSDGRQQMDLLWNSAKTPVSRPNACNFKATQPRDYLIRPARTAGIERQAYLSSDEIPNSISILHRDSDRIFSFQSTTAQVLNHDLAPSALTSNLDVVAPDLQCALSLLSTSSWGLNESEPTSVEQSMHVNQRSVARPSMHVEPQNGALASSRYVLVEQPPAMPHMHSLDLDSSGSSQFPEFQSFKTPLELGCFYPNQIN